MVLFLKPTIITAKLCKITEYKRDLRKGILIYTVFYLNTYLRFELCIV